MSAFVLVILAALPVTSTVCAADCDTPAKAISSDHASGVHCEETSPASDGPAIAPAAHDCGAHALPSDVALRPMSRTYLSTAAALLAIGIADTTLNPPSMTGSSIRYTRPRGSAPPTSLPLVLRI